MINSDKKITEVSVPSLKPKSPNTKALMLRIGAVIRHIKSANLLSPSVKNSKTMRISKAKLVSVQRSEINLVNT